MNSSPQTAQIILELDDAAFWADPSASVSALTGKLANAGFDGVLLGAPRVVPLSERATLPLVALRAGTCRQVYEVSMQEHAQVLLMDLRANRLSVAQALDTDDTERPGPDDVDDGYTAELHLLELRELLELPWKPNAFLVWVLLRERLSAPVRVELVRGGFRDEEVERFIEAQRRLARRPLPISPAPGDPLPCYLARADSPALPDAPGIAITVPRILVLDADVRCVLTAAFRLPIEPHEQCAAPIDAALPDSAPTAVVRVTLLVVGAQDGRQALVEIQAPSYAPVEQTEDGLIASGYFAFDLLDRLGRVPQTYFVYAFSREIQRGPALTAWISMDMLAP